MWWHAGWVLGAFATALAAGFVAGTAGAQPVAERVQTLQLTNGRLPAAQQLVGVLKGDAVRWRISSNTAGELHLHAYRLRVAVQPGVPAELAFTAHATGRFRVEWHAAGGAADGAASTPAGHHHGPALLTLEVRPR